MDVLQPGSEAELEALLRSEYANGRPTYFRLSDHPHAIDTGPTKFGEGIVLKRGGAGVTVMTAGPLLGNVLPAVEGLDVNLVYFHTLKPIDAALVASFADTRILVVHDAFGLREAVNEVAGLRTWYHASRRHSAAGTAPARHPQEIGSDAPGIRAAVERLLRP